MPTREEIIREQMRRNAADLGFDPSGNPGMQQDAPVRESNFDWNTAGRWLWPWAYEEGAPASGTEKPMQGPPMPEGANVPPGMLDAPVMPQHLERTDETVTGAADESADPFAPYRQLYDQLGMPQRSTENPAQEKADAYAQREMDRTRLLARLAFAAGLTNAGGPGWSDIGAGFTNAAQAYDQGHERYLKALQGSADRYQSQRDQAYEDQVRRASTIADLYTSGEKQKTEREKIAALTDEKRNKMLRESLKFIFGEDPDFQTPEERERDRRLRELSIIHGRPILEEYDVTE